MPRRSSPSRLSRSAATIAALILLAATACPALTADQVLLLVNRTDPDAERVAEHYRTVRGVPAVNTLTFELPAGEDLSRAIYERDVLPKVREYFAVPEQAQRIRCLLSIYGMPLRIGRRAPTAEQQEQAQAMQPEVDQAAADQKTAQERLKALDDQAERTVDEEAERRELRDKLPALRRRATELTMQLGKLQGRETESSLEGELAVALWPPSDLWRWVFNPLHFAFDAQAEKPPTLLTCRLDGGTPELAMRLVDDAVKAERDGLQGTIYLDARGIKRNQDNFGYGGYDESLRELAEVMQTQTTMPVVLNDQSELFQPGDCPNAALYCGWYKLAHYVDAFDWAPGAVGYHIASSEARSLRKPDAEFWCKKMIDDGITATVGPVAEPYTIGFPKPYEFFVTLASGDYCLAETYARTAYLQSWMATLIGDPLYNPFAGRPLLQPGKLRHSPVEAPWPWSKGADAD